jgi:hypothetical protein
MSSNLGFVQLGSRIAVNPSWLYQVEELVGLMGLA